MKKQKKISPERLCRVINALCAFEGETLNETSISKFANSIYRISHLASNCGNQNHKDWITEFIQLEEDLKKGNII